MANQLDLFTPRCSLFDNITYNYITDDSFACQILEYLTELPKDEVLGVDIETTALDPYLGKIRLIQLATGSNWEHCYVFDCFKLNFEALKPKLRELFQGKKKISHNATFECKWFTHNGIDFLPPIYDTELASRLHTKGENSLRHGLKYMGRYLRDSEGIPIQVDKAEQVSDWSKNELTKEQLLYSAIDACCLIPLRQKQIECIAVDYKPLLKQLEIEFNVIPAIADKELNGLRIDWEMIEEIEDKAIKEKKENMERFIDALDNDLKLKGYSLPRGLFGECSFNVESPTQLLDLFRKAGMKIESTDEKVLNTILDDFSCLRPYFDMKRPKDLLKKIKTYKESKHSKTGKIHASFFTLRSATGRLNTNEPNVQNFQKNSGFYEAIVPSPGYKLICIDYSQIELRILAEYTQDPVLIKAYKNGDDIHSLTGSKMMGISLSELMSWKHSEDKGLRTEFKRVRQLGKPVNFGLIYGQGAKGLKRYAEQVYGVVMSIEEAYTFRAKYFDLYKGVKKYQEQTKHRVDRSKLCYAYSLSGYRQLLKGKTLSITNALNTPIQGLGASILKWALYTIHKANLENNWGLKILNSVHDEILLECPEDRAEELFPIIGNLMVDSGARFVKSVPIEVEGGIGDNWSEAKNGEIKLTNIRLFK